MLTSNIDIQDEAHLREVRSLQEIYQKYVDGGYTYPSYDKFINRAVTNKGLNNVAVDCYNKGLSFTEFKSLLKPVQTTIFDFI